MKLNLKNFVKLAAWGCIAMSPCSSAMAFGPGLPDIGPIPVVRIPRLLPLPPLPINPLPLPKIGLARPLSRLANDGTDDGCIFGPDQKGHGRPLPTPTFPPVLCPGP